MTRHKCNLSLQHLSTLAVAAGAWSTPRVVTEVKEFFKKHVNGYKKIRQEKSHFDVSKADWGLIENCVVAQFNDINLPQSCKTNLILTVLCLSVRIHQFLEDIAVKLISYGKFDKFHEDMEYYIENIRWTPFGTIDAVQIFIQRYHDDTIENDYFMWYEACIYCQEDCIRHLWRKMPNNLKGKTVSKVDWFVEREFIFVACWQQYLQGDLSTFLRKLENEKLFGLSHTSIPEDMLSISVIIGLPEAVKYYWQQLNSQQKRQNLPAIVTLLPCHGNYYLSFYHNRLAHAYCDIAAFIAAELTDERIEEFTSNIDFNAMLPLLTRWPWQSLFLQTLNKVWHLLGDDDYYSLLLHLVRILGHERKERRNNCRQFIINVWRRLSIPFKENIDCQRSPLFEGLAALDVTLVQMILADPHVHLSAADFLNASEYQFHLLIKSGNYKEIDDCVQKLCITEEERETWLNGIDVKGICKFFIAKNNHEEVDKFLNWRFDDDARKITQYKEKTSFFN